MKRTDAIPYISFGVDDTGQPYDRSAALVAVPHARLVGWQCGFEPLFVAVWSYLPGVTLDDGEAEAIARDLLEERGWFGTDSNDSNDSRPADYVL